jgi:hypothetical protein
MKTIKTFYASFAFLFLGLFPISAMGQSMPHTFTANTAATASEVNANFEYLLERFDVIRETTVNCGNSGTGSGINSAIQNGYNSIVINGICKENINLDGIEGNTPRLLKLRGANNDASQDKIIDNSSYTEHVLKFNYGGMLVTIDNLTISGGDRAITAWSNINLKIYNSKVEGYKKRGIQLGAGSVLDGKNLTIDGSYSGATSDEVGLRLWGSSVAYVENLTITNNQEYGLTTWNSHIEVDGNVTLTGNGRAINVGGAATFSSDANITISGSTDKAISVNQGFLNIWGGTTSITSTTGVILDSWMSNIHIENLTATGDGSSGNIFNIDNSVFSLKNLSLSNAGYNGIYIQNSGGEIDNLTSSNNNGHGLRAYLSRIQIKNSVISGNDDGIRLNGASDLVLKSSTISNNSDVAIQFEEGSLVHIYDSTISGVSGKQAILGDNKVLLMIAEDSGSTVISTTNTAAIYLRNSSGEIGDGVEVSSTGTNAVGIQLDSGSSIKIEDGATVNGSTNGGSIVGSMRSTIEIATGSTVSSPIWCGSDGRTMVIAPGLTDNSSSLTVGNTCIKVSR